MAQNYVLLDRIELNASANSVTFSNIPQTGYTDLKVVFSARSDYAAVGIYMGMYLNNNIASFANSKELYGTGSAAASRGATYSYSPIINGASSTASSFSNGEIYIPNYTGSTYKSASADSVQENNATQAFSTLTAMLWQDTSAINAIKLLPDVGNFVSGSTFSLYGIAAVGTTPAIAPKADGGNVIATDGTYWYHAFLSNGTFTPQVGLTADVLVVAGGGGGGSGNNSGGGGAGGLLAFTSQALTATGYTCTVGAGGATGTPDGVNGSDSQFGALTLVKGGGYGGGDTGGATPHIGGNGGSGGGSSFNYTSGGGTPTSGQGYAGGAGQGGAPDYYGGGGGGSAEAGNTDSIGYGGDGLSTYSSWGLATVTGQNVSGTVYFAGGGGGAGQASSTPTAGGLGGGGNGAGSSGASAGTANTGGGGGGSGNSAGNIGKAGGSGIIIVRYLVA